MTSNILCDRLILLRKSKNLKQADVASVLGTTEGSYRHYESGRSTPNAHQLGMLADFFKVTTDYLLGRDAGLPPDKKELIDIIMAMPDNKVSALLSIAKTIE